MQFTPQQLAGAQKYSASTRIGNWLEDCKLQESKVAEFERKKNQGTLGLGFKQQKLSKCNQMVPLSYSEDGLIRFGDAVILGHPQVQGSLACDLWEETSHGSNQYEVTVSKQMSPCARNVFIVKRVSTNKLRDMAATQYEADDILHFGEPFHLECNPSLLLDERTQMLDTPKYLASAMKTAALVTRLSNRQLVFMSEECDNNTVWVCHSLKGGVDRLLQKGVPVEVMQECVIQHRGTGLKLCADAQFMERNDFGAEAEVSCDTKKTAHRQLTLMHENEGTMTGETLDRSELPENRWIFITADNPDQAADNRNLPGPMTPQQLVQKTIEILRQRGEGSVRGLRRSFRIMDDGRDGKLDREDFKWGLKDYGVHLTDKQFDILLDYFDDNKDGLISINEFLNGIRGPMNQRREDLVRIAYERLDKNCDGTVTKADIEMAYDVSQNPKVISGEWTPDEAIREFMELWETQEQDGVITMSEFIQYYTDLSAEIEEDDYFELMIRNAWHISGGEGWSANTSNLRVLVTYLDDSQEVVECKDDLGLDTGDMTAIIQHLENQGVRNIKSVSVADAC
mmetsp:Transcript_30404/g.39238  ORF Transcript_30404/g.39238 Transcript_30404/m.39238 type:complete len:568 (-) Transcript_30404:239-1942(-)